MVASRAASLSFLTATTTSSSLPLILCLMSDTNNLVNVAGPEPPSTPPQIQPVQGLQATPSDNKGTTSRAQLGGHGASVPEHRMHRVIVAKMLRPIHELRGREFMKAWFDCVKCHHDLWINDIQQGGPSLYNLMYSRKDGAVCGVLDDWDLENITGKPNSYTYLEHTAICTGRSTVE
ncbi:hypothetical protein FA95DRAFT_1149735 [Auriscalpium vulgare]|uniref:Uncharacterized protein n=1 Tax=Auriscalpium vulgare TaxID=40419 RepID=A0ACB8R554_9AGAM|nr:hypothetical protein FA95DRAFT_1149735 [Auriscalpium vulgare]